MNEKEPRKSILPETEHFQPEMTLEPAPVIEKEPKETSSELEVVPSPVIEPSPGKTTEEIMAQDTLLAWFAQETGEIPKWYATEAYTEGPQALQFLLDTITSAEEEVSIRMFSWANDDSGRKVLQALRRLREHKPHVKITAELDWLGCLFVGTLPKGALARARHFLPKLPKIIFGAFRYGISPLTLYRAWGARKNVLRYDRIKPKQRRKLSQLAAELFPREALLMLNPTLAALQDLLGENLTFLANGGIDDMDHVKRIQADARKILGGRNIGNDYFGEKAWVDYTFSLSEEAEGRQPSAEHVLALQVRNEPGYVPKEERPERKQVTFVMLELIKKAQHSIEIEHAYVASSTIRRELLRAAKRGVKVTIIRSQPEEANLEAANEEIFAQLGAPRRKWWDRLLWWWRLDRHKNITVRFSPKVSHAKLLITDGRYILASSANMNRQSLYRHGEDGVLFLVEGPDTLPPNSAPRILMDTFAAHAQEATAL